MDVETLKRTQILVHTHTHTQRHGYRQSYDALSV